MQLQRFKEEQTTNQSPTTSGAANTPFEDKGQLSSLSHSPSPRIASILIHPSDSGASRPRSSEGRINLPRNAPTKGHRVVSSHKKRSIGSQVDKVLEKEPPVKTDPFLNFGVGDNFAYSEDPLILEDVQKALDFKARRFTQQRSPSTEVSQDSRDFTSSSQTIARKSSQSSKPISLPGTQPFGRPFQYPSKLYFPPSRHTSSLSLQSDSSEELPSKSPVPVLFSFPNGNSYLDWSGTSTAASPESKDKSTIKRRTFSLSKSKAKSGEFSRNGGSLGLGTNQKDFHVALLNNVRHNAKKDTLTKAEKVKEELSRRYSFLGHRKSTGVNPLVVLRARQHDSPAPSSWYSWRSASPSQVSRWILTASMIDEYLCSIGMSFPDSTRSLSPVPRFSPLSSPRQSFSSSPTNRNRKEAKSIDFEPSLPSFVAEVSNFSRPILSIDPIPLPMSSRTSLQAPSSSVAESIGVLTGRSEGTKREKSPTKSEGHQSFGRRLRASLGELAKDSAALSTLSSKYTHIKGSLSTGGQRGPFRASLDNFRKSGDEAISPSSLSDGGDSAAILTRELNTIPQKATSLKVPVDKHKSRFDDRSKALNTSESESGATSFDPYRSQRGVRGFQGSLSAGEEHSRILGSTWPIPDSSHYGQIYGVKNRQQELQRLLKLEEEEEELREVYRRREQLLKEANEHNRKIARILKAVCTSLEGYQRMQLRFVDAGDIDYSPLPKDVLTAIRSDPASTLRHGKGWEAVEHAYDTFHLHQAALSSYISKLISRRSHVGPCKLESSIETAKYLWEHLHKACEQINSRAAVIESALERAGEHIQTVQDDYNRVQKLTETDYPENQTISDLETYILESQTPRGWLEFVAIWVPVHVLEVVGGFIRFFGVPISEKFIRPFLWYFFRDQYYWKVYSTEPPPNERTWYTRTAYWFIIISILAWYVTPGPKVMHIPV